MSATNRGFKRIESDFYPTPIETINSFLNHYQLKDGVILEPCAGNGNFIKAIRDNGYKNYIIANELRSEENDNLLEVGANEIHNYDFLNNELNIKPKTIITNPPYSIAEQFIKKCKEQFPEAEIIMLLRLAFLESRRRYGFWQQYPVNKLFVLSKRPSFLNNDKSDATAYDWFVWDNTDRQEIKII